MADTALSRWWRRLAEGRRIRAWRRAGSPVPPPRHWKRHVLREVGRALRLSTLVETGTWKGGTIAALAGDFSRIVSIELSPAMARTARERVARCPHVEVREGDSAEVLPAVLGSLREPALFWLDAHWSEGASGRGDVDTPVRRELAAILDHPVPGHVVLVDDARLFDGTHDYPTIEEVRSQVAARRPDWEVDVKDDAIRIRSRATRLP